METFDATGLTATDGFKFLFTFGITGVLKWIRSRPNGLQNGSALFAITM